MFNKEDVKSWTTCSEVNINEEGYFGYNLHDLEYCIKYSSPKKLTEINVDSANSFKAEGAWYPFFLPIYNVKKTYRPLKTFDELFNFLMPNNDEEDTDRKAELLLGKVYRLKEKTTGNVSYRFFHVINQYDGIIRINGFDLEYLFDKYEIKKNGKWVPFGIEN